MSASDTDILKPSFQYGWLDNVVMKIDGLIHDNG